MKQNFFSRWFVIGMIAAALVMTGCSKDDKDEPAPEHIAITGVTLSINEAFLDPTENIQLTATIAPENATNQKLTWKSSNPSVATVDGNGLVTAIKEGKTEVIVTTDDGKKTATCIIIVEKVKYEIVNTNAKGEILGKIKQNQTITLDVNNSFYFFIKAKDKEKLLEGIGGIKKRTVEVSDQSVVNHIFFLIDILKPLKTGEVTITSRWEFENGEIFEHQFKVQVTGNEILVESVEIVDSNEITLKKGEQKNLNVKVLPENATNQKVTWSSGNPQVATVSDQGRLTAIDRGETTITVTSANGKIATCKVIVSDFEISDLGAKINLEEAKKGYMTLVMSKDVDKLNIQMLADDPFIWIDLNNDGEKQKTEEFNSQMITLKKKYEHTAKIITIYGKVTKLDVEKNRKIRSIDIRKNSSISWLLCSENDLTSLIMDKNNNFNLKDVEIRMNSLSEQQMSHILSELPNKNGQKGKILLYDLQPKAKERNKTNLEQKLITQAKDKNWNLDYINKDGYRKSL
ncbi:Ig domain-containing protein [Capnocytophaga canimorsus]|uniref:Ig domain-containing protein n=1 Tax=Capnocytophaga canimorsus TaxID=28188 RepID=UPI0037D484E8